MVIYLLDIVIFIDCPWQLLNYQRVLWTMSVCCKFFDMFYHVFLENRWNFRKNIGKGCCCMCSLNITVAVLSS
jgi:hypothetical protein